MTLGEIIKDFRHNQTPTLTIDEFAKRIGCSKGYVSMLENNKFPNGRKVKPSVDIIYKVSRVMGISIDDLISMLDDDYIIVVNNSESDLPQNEMDMIDKYRKLPADAQNVVRDMIDSMYNTYYLQKGDSNTNSESSKAVNTP